MGLPWGFKADADRIAVGLRHQMGLSDGAPMDLHALATKLGLQIIPVSMFADVCPQYVTQLIERDTGAFSGSLLRLFGYRIILVNDGHSSGRQSSDIAHEIAHALLAHPPQPFDHVKGRGFDKEAEKEADCLAGYILIPNKAAHQIVRSGCNEETACDQYGVSRKMLEYRLNMSGARIVQDRLHQRRKRPRNRLGLNGNANGKPRPMRKRRGSGSP